MVVRMVERDKKIAKYRYKWKKVEAEHFSKRIFHDVKIFYKRSHE